jgi:hypothetical protein
MTELVHRLRLLTDVIHDGRAKGGGVHNCSVGWKFQNRFDAATAQRGVLCV